MAQQNSLMANIHLNLDELNGHSHSTNEYEDGTYHYHATSTSPYLLGGFKGKYGSLNGGGYFTN